MVDTALLLRRLTVIRHSLARLESKQGLTREAFLADADAQDVVLRNLQVGVQACLDAGLHIIQDSGWELPGASVVVFEILARHGVVPAELASRLRRAAQMRNLLVHAYDAIDMARVHQTYTESSHDLEQFCRAVVAFYSL